jgi:hypothetical protein
LKFKKKEIRIQKSEIEIEIDIGFGIGIGIEKTGDRRNQRSAGRYQPQQL